MIATAFQRMIDRMRCSMSRSQLARSSRAGVVRLIGQSLEQIGRACRAMMVENSPQRIDPFASLDGVQICRSSHELLPRLSCLNSMDGPCQMARTGTEIQLFGFPRTPAPSALPDGLAKSFG